jgi:hypothetical protein
MFQVQPDVIDFDPFIPFALQCIARVDVWCQARGEVISLLGLKNIIMKKYTVKKKAPHCV